MSLSGRLAVQRATGTVSPGRPTQADRGIHAAVTASASGSIHAIENEENVFFGGDWCFQVCRDEVHKDHWQVGFKSGSRP